MRLLALKPGERVVELACGNGQFSREMARAGARIVATDIAASFIDIARAHTEAAGLDVDFRVADATDEPALLALADAGTVDAMVCTMAIHDIPDLHPMMRAAAALLAPHGRFVCSVMHPCFNMSNPVFVSETADNNGVLSTDFSLKIGRYIGREPELGLGIIGQPEPHWYFPKTLEALLAPAFAAGLVLDGLEEPAFPPAAEEPRRAPSWANYPHIPPVLVARFRPETAFVRLPRHPRTDKLVTKIGRGGTPPRTHV